MQDPIELTGAIDGFRLFKSALEPAAQHALIGEIQTIIADAPLFQPVMPRSGKPFSVRMTNAGPLGWVSDRDGYRYQAHHPDTGAGWPAIPGALLSLWFEAGGYPHPPECCLINLYATPRARMGLHVDSDEDDPKAPIVSLSLGDSALFRLGGRHRSDPTRSVTLISGDVVVMGGPARHAYHGIDRITPETSTLVPDGGRINVTLRRVTRPRDAGA